MYDYEDEDEDIFGAPATPVNSSPAVNFRDELNDDQFQAVTAPDGPALVLAGAGSGKTRVLVHRIAWNVEAMSINPSSIMAVTFTNKAAQEMQSRIQELLQSPAGDMWCGTFHGLAHRTLKRFYKEVNY